VEVASLTTVRVPGSWPAYLESLSAENGGQDPPQFMLRQSFIDCKEYLSRCNPLSLRWAEQSCTEQDQLIDLVTIIKLVKKNGKEIPRSHVQKQAKIGKGTFGSIFKATYNNQVYALKCNGKVFF
jgi:hypothetical protein